MTLWHASIDLLLTDVGQNAATVAKSLRLEVGAAQAGLGESLEASESLAVSAVELGTSGRCNWYGLYTQDTSG